MTGEEQIRRVLLFWHALWEAREEFVDRAERETDRESLDWFQRERFDASMEQHRRVIRAVHERRLDAAYREEPASVRCTPEERSEARRMARQILEEGASPEAAVDRLLSDAFPHEVSGGNVGRG